jgi:protein-histidine pros-kinase
MSHELRTPLNAIIGFTGTLLMKLPGPLTADQEKQLRIVQASARHLLLLINDMLDLAKIESGKIQLHVEPLVAQQLLHEIAATLRPAAEIKSIGFELETPAEEVVIRSDRRAFTQIVLNIASNAIKFTDRGKVRLELGRQVVDGQPATAVIVTDTGIGIRPADQNLLFGAFQQADQSRRYEGTGLGLHLSQKLAVLLGGRIEFSSEFGRGSEFRLLLFDR